MSKHRVPAGVPTGGQFAPATHAEADVQLDEDDNHYISRAGRFEPSAYMYKADLYTPEGIVDALVQNGTLPPEAAGMDVEDALDYAADLADVDRDDEWSFDTDDFPKVMFEIDMTDGDTVVDVGGKVKIWGPPTSQRADDVEIDDTPVDLRSLLEERLEGPEALVGVPGIKRSGPRGWTVKVADTLAPFTSPAHVSLAYGTGRENRGDLVYFDGVGPAEADVLLRRMPRGALNGKGREWEPAPRDYLETIRDNPGVVEAGGYVIGPNRADERVTFKSVVLYSDAATTLEAADELRERSGGRLDPVNVERVNVPWRGGQQAWFCDLDVT